MTTYARQTFGQRHSPTMLKQSRFANALRAALVALLMCTGGTAWAATFTATLDGTFPLQMAPGDTLVNAFAVKLAASGNFPSAHNGSISVCDAITLGAGGTLDCTHTATYALTNANPPTGFPSDVQVSVTVASDVACGSTYNMAVGVSLNVTGGADFGEDEFGAKIKQLSLAFTTQVLCADVQAQGCSQGYWKNHTESWMGYSPNEHVGALFSSAPAELSNNTLLEALSFQGGSTLEGAAQILLRQAVAAALNDSHYLVTYPRTLAEITLDVNDALDSASRSNILGLAAALDGDNNLDCPLE